MAQNSPIRPTDEDARALAKELIATARFAALATTHPETGHPFVSRVSIGMSPKGDIVSLMSALSTHTQALLESKHCALLLGEPGQKGDPLTYPRVTLQAIAHHVSREDRDFPAIRQSYLTQNPKSKLYIDFADFSFFAFEVTQGDLNGGFGKAFKLSSSDIR
jgi:putative heme iron utilization protein